jgi:cyclopropane fatty-acyl-phospholipid synthase-like methyltransferase
VAPLGAPFHDLTNTHAHPIPQATAQYDRIVSIEMFEHMKNYQELLRRCSTWLRPGGQLFVHIFCHKTNPYHFEVGWAPACVGLFRTRLCARVRVHVLRACMRVRMRLRVCVFVFVYTHTYTHTHTQTHTNTNTHNTPHT